MLFAFVIRLLSVALRLLDVSLITSLVDTTVADTRISRHDDDGFDCERWEDLS